MATENSGKTGAPKAPGRPFRKGTSGNPGGRPRGAYAEACKRFADEKGWDLLERIALGKERSMRQARARLEALKLLIAYGYGKPRERTEVTGADGQPLLPEAKTGTEVFAKFTLAELQEFAHALAAQGDARTK